MILFVASLGIWGCARGSAGLGGNQDKIKALETRLVKLERDFRAVVKARDQLRQKVATLEQEKLDLQKEHDDLQQQLTSRTSERDSTQVQFEQFRKNIRQLLGQAETAANTTASPPVTAVSNPPVLPGNS
jgi:chromosome segregation ATPase